jgi:hypothetical protein
MLGPTLLTRPMRTFIASNPNAANRYVRVFEAMPGMGVDPTVYRSRVTGYKMELDDATGCYDSFIRLNGDPRWQVYSTRRQLSSQAALDYEIAQGYLIEQPTD